MTRADSPPRLTIVEPAGATFDERLHPRGAGGRFIRKAADAAEASPFLLGATIAPELKLTDFADGNYLTTVKPLDGFEASAALWYDQDTAPTDEVTLVKLGEQYPQPFEYSVHGPEDGRPILVNISSGMGTLNLEGGFVVIRQDSDSPVEVNVESPTELVMMVGRGRQASVVVNSESRVTIVAESGCRGMARVEHDRGMVDIVGDDARFKVVHTHSWS